MGNFRMIVQPLPCPEHLRLRAFSVALPPSQSRGTRQCVCSPQNHPAWFAKPHTLPGLGRGVAAATAEMKSRKTQILFARLGKIGNRGPTKLRTTSGGRKSSRLRKNFVSE